MTKKEKMIEIAISNMINNQTKRYSRDLIICAEILNQITEKGFVFDYTKFSLDDQKLASDIAYNIFQMEEDVSNSKCAKPEYLFGSDEEIGELYTGDEEDVDIDFDGIGDFIPITGELNNLYEVLSGIGVPNIIFDGTGYCYNGEYYKIKDVGIEEMVLDVTPIDKSELDEICIKLLENQM